MTIEAASAPDTKKIATSSITTTEVIGGQRHVRRAARRACPPRWPTPARSVPPRCIVDPGTAEDREPHERHDARHQQHAGDELADGATTRDAGDEHADERRPADPPGPVEDRPARQPLLHGVAARRVRAGGHHREVLEVRADRGRDEVEDEDGRADDEDEDRQRQGQHHVDVGQPLDALGDTGDGREDEADGQHRDDRDEQHVARLADAARRSRSRSRSGARRGPARPPSRTASRRSRACR